MTLRDFIYNKPHCCHTSFQRPKLAARAAHTCSWMFLGEMHWRQLF